MSVKSGSQRVAKNNTWFTIKENQREFSLLLYWRDCRNFSQTLLRMINEIVQNLIAVNRIAEGQNLSFEDALSIVTIYDELPEPNNLIDEAEELAVSNIDDLEKLAIAIEEESERFLDLGLPLLKNIFVLSCCGQPSVNIFYVFFVSSITYRAALFISANINWIESVSRQAGKVLHFQTGKDDFPVLMS